MRESILRNFPIHTPKTQLAVDLIVGIINTKQVSSSALARYVSGSAIGCSKSRRIERLYREGYVTAEELIEPLQNIFGNKKFKLSFDRTNWKFGEQDINAFVAFASRGKEGSLVSLKMLDNKGGNSNNQDRIELAQSVITRYGKENIDSLLADREFFSGKFAMWLIEQDIPFAIRLKENLIFVQKYLRYATSKGKVFKNIVIMERKGRNICCDLSIKKLADEYLIIASYKVANPLVEYRKRWVIERFFLMLKTGGFNIESTKITKPERLEILFLLCAIAYLICLKLGIYRHCKVRKMRWKKRNKCYEYSFFRWGLDWLKELVISDPPKVGILITYVVTAS